MTNRDNELEFMKAKVVNAVLIEGDEMVKIISMVGGSRDPKAPSLIQVEM